MQRQRSRSLRWPKLTPHRLCVEVYSTRDTKAARHALHVPLGAGLGSGLAPCAAVPGPRPLLQVSRCEAMHMLVSHRTWLPNRRWVRACCLQFPGPRRACSPPHLLCSRLALLGVPREQERQNCGWPPDRVGVASPLPARPREF